MTTFNLNHGLGNPRNSEGAFVALKDSSILFAYSKYSGDTWYDHCPADIAGIVSHDGGHTWGEPRIIVKNDAQNVMSVSFLRLQNGKIAMVYIRKSKIDGGKADTEAMDTLEDDGIDCRPWFCTSDDEGLTWSKPVDVAGVTHTYLCVNNGRLVQLSNGRLILPAAYHWPRKGGINLRGIPVFFLSDDDGATWHESTECLYPPQHVISGLREPGVIELKDGRIMAWARSNDFDIYGASSAQYKSFSSDNGETWEAPVRATEFPSLDSPLSIKREPRSGRLFAVWADFDPRWPIHHYQPVWDARAPLVIAYSEDEGRFWRGHTLLESEPGHGYCYTAIHFTDDNALLLAYCCGSAETGGLIDCRIRRIELDELEKKFDGTEEKELLS